MDPSPGLIDGVAAATQRRDREGIEQSLVELVLEFLAAQSVGLFRIVRNGMELDHALPAFTAKPGLDGADVVRESGEPLDLAALPAWRLCIEQQFPKVGAIVPGLHETLFPVLGESGDTVALLQIVGPRAPDARDLYVVGGILQILRNHLALIDYGERDTLTGLLNRKTFETQFARLRSTIARPRATHADDAGWIGLIDIDHFKSINDRFGHVFGDEVLLMVSQILQRTFRGADRIYRFGGEEFVVLMQDTTPAITANAFERVRAAVERHHFPQLERVTISLGWTRVRPQDAPTNAIERADMALYHAKRSGRNRTCHYDAVVASGEMETSVQPVAQDIELF